MRCLTLSGRIAGLCLAFVLGILQGGFAAEQEVRVATFSVDVTPPLGSPLCDGYVPAAAKIDDPLFARGVVIIAGNTRVVLCAVDWVGIGNGGYRQWRKSLAEAAGTTPQNVSLHCLHPHDAPGCDFDAEMLLAGVGLSGAEFNVPFAHEAIEKVAAGIKLAIEHAQLVTHVGIGEAKVDRVASNRRLLGPDGKVQHIRFSSCKDEAVRALPEGTIDPMVQSVTFWNGERPIVEMTYYATHPQSYYGQGGVSCDFVGLARGIRDKEAPEHAHVHFNGASGNVAAGKYNDGSIPRRMELAGRLADGMTRAFAAAKKYPIRPSEVAWRVLPITLPMTTSPSKEELGDILRNSNETPRNRIQAARDLTWLLRDQQADPIEIACLDLGRASILHMPGELFIEYQLAAKEMRKDVTVCMAAYGDYGPGYIGTTISYSQGGYETGRVSRVAPSVEPLLLEAMQKILKAENPRGSK